MSIIYCNVCKMPPEYCEFGKTLPPCKAWLADAHPELFQTLYPTESAITEKPEALITAEQAVEQAAEKTAKPQKKDKPVKQVVKKVFIQTQDRTKRKRVTIVTGLDAYGVDLKKAAKQFAGKFACGCAVTKVATGEEIAIQGDFADEVLELIQSLYTMVVDIEIMEQKKKK